MDTRLRSVEERVKSMDITNALHTLQGLVFQKGCVSIHCNLQEIAEP